MALSGKMMVLKFVAKLRQKTVTGLVKSINERPNSLFARAVVCNKGLQYFIKGNSEYSFLFDSV